MVTWNEFIWFGAASVLLSASGAAAAYFEAGNRAVKARLSAILLSTIALVAFASFISCLWISLGRPPLRTMGETCLWYSFFAMVSGLFTYVRWRYKWILSFSTVLATVFIMINILKPEIHDETLMPALQSPWFIPHVTVYMFSYSLLGCAFLFACAGLFTDRYDVLDAADTLVYIGLAFLTFGMLSGALWAKQAWGHYWSWDPKETWALLTWLCYMCYIHLRLFSKGSRKALCILLIFSFMCLQMCWWGVNYLPSAQESIHVYNR